MAKKPVEIYEGMNLPVRAMVSDLTKTLAVTILALILQLALNVYLQKGGWQTVKSLLPI